MEIKVPSTFVLFAKRNTGKTVLGSHIIKHLYETKKIDYVCLFSQTAHLSGDFGFLPKNSKHDDFSEKAVNKIIDYQDKNRKSKKPKQCLLVLDDTISMISHKFGGLLNRLFTAGRHYNISVMFITQYPKANNFSPSCRSNIDYLFFSVNTITVLKFIYELVVYDGTIQEFLKWVQDNTNDFQFILYDNLQSGADKFFFVKADIIDDSYKIKKF
jgi:hypothetical protein